MAIANQPQALFRFRIREDGGLIPIETGTFDPHAPQHGASDISKNRAGPGTVSIFDDGTTEIGAPVTLADYLTLAKSIRIPSPGSGLPFSMIGDAYFVSWQSLRGQPAGSITPTRHVELPEVRKERGANF